MSSKARSMICAVLGVLIGALAPCASAQAADHQLLGAISGERIAKGEQFEDACGVAVDPAGNVFVADYYQNRVVAFNHKWEYLRQIEHVEPLDPEGVRPQNGPCDLAVDPAGNLYVASYHGALRRYPSGEGPAQLIDPGPVTGIATDPATGDLYVDLRDRIARYAAPIAPGDAPAQLIGEGDLSEGYGMAISGFGGDAEYASTAGYLYVADAASGTLKAYDPAQSPTQPIQQIGGEGTAQGGFHLQDADLEVDPSDGHLYLSDNLEPGFEERPELVVDEFSPAGYYRGSVPPSFLGGSPSFLVAAEPSALAIAGGDLYVTSGNGEGAAVYAFGPPAPAEARTLEVRKTGSGQGTVTSIPAAIACGPLCEGEFDKGSTVILRAEAAPGSAFAGWSGCDSEPSPGRCAVGMAAEREVTADFGPEPGGSALAAAASGGEAPGPGPAPPSEGPAAASARRSPGATVVRGGGLQLALAGRISPRALPRRGAAPVAVAIGGELSTTDGSQLPQLKRIAVELNRGGQLQSEGLPACPIARIAIASSQRALAACRGALVGRGRFEANILLRGQAPYPTAGELLLFNATEGGRPVLYGHLYAAKPFATSFVIRFAISHRARGRFGTVLSASLPEALGDWGYLTAIQIRLARRYSYRGETRSYVSAGCPAPKGFAAAPFTLARASFAFAGGRKLSGELTRSCRALG